MRGLEVGTLERVAHQGPEFLLERADRHVPPVGGLIYAVARHATGQQVFAARTHPPVREHFGEREDRVGERGIGHRDVDVAAVSSGLGVDHRDEQAEQRRHAAAEQIADLQVRDRRRAARRADLVEDARIADVIDVVPGTLRVRSGLPVTGNAAQDDPRIPRAQHVVADAELVHHARTKAFDDDVGRLDEPQEEVAARVLLEVQAQALLAAVDDLVEKARVAVSSRPSCAHSRRAGVFDLDDLGAVVGEMLCRERPRQQTREVEDAQARAGVSVSCVGFVGVGPTF